MSQRKAAEEELEVEDEEEVRTFHGYACTQDCSGHEAGYEWAEEKEIADADDCTGNNDSFIEGCLAFVEEHAEEAKGEDWPSHQP